MGWSAGRVRVGSVREMGKEGARYFKFLGCGASLNFVWVWGGSGQKISVHAELYYGYAWPDAIRIKGLVCQAIGMDLVA